eukprot:GFYU01009766.1.p1 GENE.GFYU01009766.1~~GFYU01009766.1.p1  ORF type:complete len:405 (-),score=126.60 GFYU01009766.1:343-1557(-)
MAQPEDDTLLAAFEFVKYALKPEATYQGTVCFHVKDPDGSVLSKYVTVRGEEAFHSPDAPGDSPLKCSIHCERQTLLFIISGTLEPTMALMCGQVVVDDLNELQLFSKSFSFSRDKFEEFKQSAAQQQEESSAAAEAETAETLVEATPPATAPPDEDTVAPPLIPAASASSSDVPGVAAAAGGGGVSGEPPITGFEDVSLKNSPKGVVRRTIQKASLKKQIAQQSLKVLVGAKKLGDELDKEINDFKNSPRYQRVVLAVNDTTDQVSKTETFGKLKQVKAKVEEKTPAPVKKGFGTTVIGLKKLGAFTGEKLKSAGKRTVEVLTKTAYAPEASEAEVQAEKERKRTAERQSLESKLAALKAKNEAFKSERSKSGDGSAGTSGSQDVLGGEEGSFMQAGGGDTTL